MSRVRENHDVDFKWISVHIDFLLDFYQYDMAVSLILCVTFSKPSKYSSVTETKKFLEPAVHPERSGVIIAGNSEEIMFSTFVFIMKNDLISTSLFG